MCGLQPPHTPSCFSTSLARSSQVVVTICLAPSANDCRNSRQYKFHRRCPKGYRSRTKRRPPVWSACMNQNLANRCSRVFNKLRSSLSRESGEVPRRKARGACRGRTIQRGSSLPWIEALRPSGRTRAGRRTDCTNVRQITTNYPAERPIACCLA